MTAFVDVAELSDAGLAQQVVAGSHDAFAEVYERHGAHVHRLARRLPCGSGAADDVVQEVFLRFWNRPDRFDPARGSLRSFLMLTAQGRSIDLLRSDDARRTREKTRAGDRGDPTAQATDDSALALLAGERAWQLLAHLDEEERRAVALAYFGGHTYREVATVLSVPEGTVKSRIRRGLAQLRGVMTPTEA
ncbi:MAG: sigma-70 family RNA polymerase sigma factor [Acidimicrobiales bacterium]